MAGETAIDPAALPYRPCVGVVLMNREGLVFAGQRLDTPGAWQMPQGGIDKGEEPLEAALRELGEETGVGPGSVEFLAQTRDWLTYDLPPRLLGKVWNGRFRGQRQIWALFRFHGSDDEVRLDQPHPEFGEWAWMRPADVVERIVPFKRAIYTRVFADFADRLAPG
ncbi:RNA pyrophosphohydrolase [Amaricoccus solimangrovi]|uniref:RNA pyrophosphohydrolase n=1 Tax=Amaricoccus solimangrovi TaxID=2589815 RepID=A0A501X1D1_9RHOB|nr:RNA pyrophosphohydrolase [Amaricoccus solimangrovi]TPE53766.1 RNA pyrophosphohydrolase [Amaricoccus solimangrovi]